MSAQLLDLALTTIASAGHPEVADYVSNSVHFCRGILPNLPDIVSKYEGIGFMVADSNTVSFLPSTVLEMFPHYVIQGEYCASERLVEYVGNVSSDADFIIALGSGTINDICKYVSFLGKKEYISFPTAPSMNGYTSPNASITSNSGIKKSLAAQLPRDIYVDMDVVTNAPRRLINSGFADFICRSSARADWLISHLLLDTPYSELPFQITSASEQTLLDNYHGLMHRDGDTIMALMQALILSGVGMLIVGSSQPASQGEHIVASATELLDNYSFLHGERVGVATVFMLRLQKDMCGSRPMLGTTSLNEDTLHRYFDKRCAYEFCAILSRKRIDSKKAECLNAEIGRKWGQISEIIEMKVLDSVRLSSVLSYLGAPNVPEHVGWTTEQYNEIANLAFATRDRFTFLDIAHHARVSVRG